MLAQIDWTQDWYASVRPAFERLALEDGEFIDAFNRGAGMLDLRNHRGLPVRFVPQAELPDGTAYEEFIGATGCVPTRDNLHDFFNGLVWQTFPLIKRQLNALQAAQIAAAGVGKSRGPARDAATIFDENAALLVVRASSAGRELVDELRAHCWIAALFERRAAFGADAQVWLFGHALMEKLVQPYKSITAHVLTWAVPESLGADLAAWDAWLAGELARQPLVPKPFTPLPVLGVPGWWPENEAPDFYADATVFRPPRPARA